MKALPRPSAVGLLLAFTLAAALATTVGVAMWTLRSPPPPAADELAQARAVAYARGRVVGFAAGRSVGHRTGFAAGRRHGFRAGYRRGVRRGRQDGAALGRNDGYRLGFAAGLKAAHHPHPPTGASGR